MTKDEDEKLWRIAVVKDFKRLDNEVTNAKIGVILNFIGIMLIISALLYNGLL